MAYNNSTHKQHGIVVRICKESVQNWKWYRTLHLNCQFVFKPGKFQRHSFPVVVSRTTRSDLSGCPNSKFGLSAKRRHKVTKNYQHCIVHYRSDVGHGSVILITSFGSIKKLPRLAGSESYRSIDSLISQHLQSDWGWYKNESLLIN